MAKGVSLGKSEAKGKVLCEELMMKINSQIKRQNTIKNRPMAKYLLCLDLNLNILLMLISRPKKIAALFLTKMRISYRAIFEFFFVYGNCE